MSNTQNSETSHDEDEETHENFLRELEDLERKVQSIWDEFDDARYKLNENQKRINQCGSKWKDVNSKLTLLKNMFDNDLSFLNNRIETKSMDAITQNNTYRC